MLRVSLLSSWLLSSWLVLGVTPAPGCGRSPEVPWAAAQVPQPAEPSLAGDPIRLPRLRDPPRIDGKLDEEAWAQAAELGPFVSPRDGEPAADSPVAAFARAAWDAEHLYLGFVVRDAAPSSPFAPDATDPHIWERASGVEVMLQPGDPGDNRQYFEIQVDVAGAVFDTRWDDYMRPVFGEGSARLFGHQDWSCRAARAVSVEAGKFYAVELALPWAALAPARVTVPPAVGDIWRLNFYSFRDGQRQALAWSPLRGQGNFHRATRFGRVAFAGVQ